MSPDYKRARRGKESESGTAGHEEREKGLGFGIAAGIDRQDCMHSKSRFDASSVSLSISLSVLFNNQNIFASLTDSCSVPHVFSLLIKHMLQPKK